MDLYQAAVNKLLETGGAYYAFDTPQELEAMRKQGLRYQRPRQLPDQSDVQKARDQGKPVVVRFKMPDRDITVRDEVMGDVTITADELDDFIVRKSDGMPTYHLANVVDDADMGINLVLRGQEFLAQTPRHMALQQALGYPTPRYVHMPLTMDMKGRKLSKRDGAVEVFAFRQAGYLPEALLNFIALLGWSPGGDREKMTVAEMIELFNIDRMIKSNAKFDREKLLAFNTDTLAEASDDRLADAFDDYLSVNPDLPIAKADLEADTKRFVLQACRGIRTFADIQTKCGALFVGDDAIEYDPAAVKKVLAKAENAGYRMLEHLLPQFETLEPWNAENIEKLIHDVCESQNVGMGKVAQPLRVA
ncbi:MAG: glutamate--tRNA ligase, partial [Planctomycetota bacterium]